MTPEFSHRLAVVVNSPYFVDKGLGFRHTFVLRVGNKDKFSDLSDEDKKIVLEAERSVDRKRSVW